MRLGADPRSTGASWSMRRVFVTGHLLFLILNQLHPLHYNHTATNQRTTRLCVPVRRTLDVKMMSSVSSIFLIFGNKVGFSVYVRDYAHRHWPKSSRRVQPYYAKQTGSWKIMHICESHQVTQMRRDRCCFSQIWSK